jgi:hypothetical protein
MAGLERLEVMIGRWRTEGWTTDSSGVQVDHIDAVDTYERLPGGALLHLVDARVGDVKVDGAEIIGYDPARDTFVTRYFGTTRSAGDRFTGTFDHDLTVIRGRWEALDEDSHWQPWMAVTLTKERSKAP